MTYSLYWNAVLGEERDAEGVIAEFDLDPTDKQGLDEWLGLAEAEAALARGIEVPEEWSRHHSRALAELAAIR